jgi:hypothetical protein
MPAAVPRREFVLDNGNKFLIRRYNPFLSLEILGELQKRFLGPFVQLIESRDRPANGEDHFSQAMDKLSRNLDGASLVDLVKKVCHPDYVTVVVQGQEPEKFDEGMLNLAINDVSDVILLVKEVLVYNYTDLFTKGRTLIGQARENMAIQ